MFYNQDRNDYLVQVTIIEVRDLKGLDSGGTSDPFIKITVANLNPQVTETKPAANTVTYNQSFTFDGLTLSKKEL